MFRWLLRLLFIGASFATALMVWRSRKDAEKTQEFLDRARHAVKETIQKARTSVKKPQSDPTADQSPVADQSTETGETEKLDEALWRQIVAKVSGSPGILQTEVYRGFDARRRDEVRVTIRIAAETGRLEREKSGRTYALTIPQSA